MSGERARLMRARWLPAWMAEPDAALLVAFGAYLVATIAFLATYGADAAYRPFLRLPLRLAMIVLAWRAARCSANQRSVRQAWRWITGAFLLLLASDLLRLVPGLGSLQGALPALPDLLALACYPLLLRAMLVARPTRRRRAGRVAFALDSATVMIGSGMVLWFIMTEAGAVSLHAPLARLLVVAMLIGDLTLLFGATHLLLGASRAGHYGGLALAATGLFLIVASDVLAAYLWLHPHDSYAALPHLLWLAAHVPIARGARFRPLATTQPDLDTDPDAGAFSALPYIMMAIGFGVLALSAAHVWDPALGGLLLGAVALTTIAVMRQILVIRQNTRLIAQRAEQYGEARFRSLVQNASDLIAVVSPRLVVQYVTPSCDRVLGYASGELLGCNLSSMLHPDDLAAAAALLDSATRQAGTSAPVEWRLQRADGSWLYVEVVASDLRRDPHVGGIVLSMRDSTERKRAEAELRASEERYQLVLRATNDVIWEVNLITGELTWSGAVETMFGYTTQDVKGATWWDERVHPDDRERVIGGIDALLQQGGEVWCDEYRFRCGNGAYATVIDRAYVVRDQQGDPVRLIGSMMDITARKALEEQLQHQAFHDPLTELPNRALFLDRLTHALARSQRTGLQLAVLLLDLDNFKVINDSLGHHIGDQLLLAVARRLIHCIRLQDTAARFGGDEFTILLEDVADLTEATMVAERLIEQLAAPFVINGQEIYTTPSIGIALSSREHDQAELLLRNADLAMYRAKTSGKARFEVFDHSLNARVVERLQLETDLRRGLERGEFCVYYQPIIELATGRIVELEALARWQHPSLGLVAPGRFIALAEETGLIVPLGRIVLREACRQIRGWQQARPELAALSVSVNVSARQLQSPALIQDIRQALDETGLRPGALKLEITESVAMQDTATTTVTLKQLKRLGIRLAIDDFGTGYSSLGYLKRFPLDVLKIDRSFVDRLGRDTEDIAIVRAVITLAHTLGMAVTAEGIETVKQFRDLRALGCEYGQGYYFAPPLAADECESLLTAPLSYTARDSTIAPLH